MIAILKNLLNSIDSCDCGDLSNCSVCIAEKAVELEEETEKIKRKVNQDLEPYIIHFTKILNKKFENKDVEHWSKNQRVEMKIDMPLFMAETLEELNEEIGTAAVSGVVSVSLSEFYGKQIGVIK